MKNYIIHQTGVVKEVNGFTSEIINIKSKEIVSLRNHQLEHFGKLPEGIMLKGALKPGVEVHYVEVYKNGGIRYYIDADYYSSRLPDEGIALGTENTPKEFKEYWRFIGPEEKMAAKESGFYGHIKFITSVANIRLSGEEWIGVDNNGTPVGIEKEIGKTPIPDVEADFRNIIRMTTGSTLFESTLKIEWPKRKGPDGKLHQLCHITIPQWNGDLPLFVAGESVFVRSGAASVKLRFNDLKSYILSPESYIQTLSK